MTLTLGVLSTNLCFPSSGPSCAFSFSSFATSSSIWGEKIGAGLSHLQLTSPPPSTIHSIALHQDLGQISLASLALLLSSPTRLPHQQVRPLPYQLEPSFLTSLSPTDHPALRPPGLALAPPPPPGSHLLRAGLLLFQFPYVLALKPH